MSLTGIPLSYEPLVAPARPRRQIWRTLLGLAITGAVYFGWMVGLAMPAAWYQGVPFDRLLYRVATGADPWGMILLLGGFLGGWIGVWVAIRLLHRRRLGSLLGRAPAVLRDFVTGLVILALIGGGLTLVMMPMLPPLTLRPDVSVWLAFLPLALLGVLIQTGAEELLFRGYLQSQLAARFARPLIYLTLPAILFGLAHYNAEERGADAWLVVGSTALFGLIAADVTQRTGNLGMAWGLHFANNVLAMLVLSVTGALNGLALFEAGDLAPEMARPLLIADMLVTVAVWAVCRLWLRRR